MNLIIQSKQNDVVHVQHKTTKWQAFKNKCSDIYRKANNYAIAGVATAVAFSPAHAASIDFSGATTELDGVKTAILAIIGTLVVVIGIGIAWSYFKRTAK